VACAGRAAAPSRSRLTPPGDRTRNATLGEALSRLRAENRIERREGASPSARQDETDSRTRP
jgi:hypothetical protein